MVRNRFFVGMFFFLLNNCATCRDPENFHSNYADLSNYADPDDLVLCNTPEFQAFYAAFQQYCQKVENDENDKECHKDKFIPEGLLMAEVSGFCIKSEHEHKFTLLSKKKLLKEQKLLITSHIGTCIDHKIWVVRQGTKWEVIKVAYVTKEGPYICHH